MFSSGDVQPRPAPAGPVRVTDLTAPTVPEQALAESSLLAFNAALEVNAALLVDRLAGLRGTDAFVSSEPPAEDSPAFFGTTYIDSSGTRWQELNLQILSQHPAFLSISA